MDDQNIAEIINLKEFSKPMIDLPLVEKDGDNRQFLEFNWQSNFSKMAYRNYLSN